jgi:hypothetical protein
MRWEKSFDGGEVVNPHAYRPRPAISEEEKQERRRAEAEHVEHVRLVQEAPALKKRSREISRKQRAGLPIGLFEQATLDRWRLVKKKLGL